MTIPEPPVAGPHGQDSERIQYTRMCRRILYGGHLSDVLDRLRLQIPDVRREAWGHPDMGSNPFKAVWTALSTLYDRQPSVAIVEDGLVGPAGELASRAAGQGLWQLMARGQRDTQGLRELWMFPSVDPRPGVDGAYDPVYEPVYPDLVCAEDDPSRPGVPVVVWRARPRAVAGAVDPEWMWDEIDLRDPDAPSYRVLRKVTTTTRQGGEAQSLVDVSSLYDVDGWPDVWRDATGRPIMPAVLYHAAQTPWIYDAYQSRELVEGTLNVAVLRTYVAHVARSAAWRQRYVIDAELLGTSEVDENGDGRGRSRVQADPATILQFVRREGIEGANPQAGTFDVPVLPEELWSYIEGYERKLISEAGVNPADQQAMGGDARSGYALAVSRDAQREAQRRCEPMFRRGDQELLRLTAIMLNRAEGRTGSRAYPEFGYRVTYHGVPQSAMERQALREHLLALMGSGLIDPVSAYQELHPGTTDEQALKALQGVAEVKAKVASASGTDVQATALNGAQATALAALAAQVAQGQLPSSAAKAVAAVAFPGVPASLLDSIFAGLESFKPREEVSNAGQM